LAIHEELVPFEIFVQVDGVGKVFVAESGFNTCKCFKTVVFGLRGVSFFSQWFWGWYAGLTFVSRSRVLGDVFMFECEFNPLQRLHDNGSRGIYLFK
jgi:hypothetical protein